MPPKRITDWTRCRRPSHVHIEGKAEGTSSSCRSRRMSTCDRECVPSPFPAPCPAQYSSLVLLSYPEPFAVDVRDGQSAETSLPPVFREKISSLIWRGPLPSWKEGRTAPLRRLQREQSIRAFWRGARKGFTAARRQNGFGDPDGNPLFLKLLPSLNTIIEDL